jgi:tRNA nucleotidyltransferase/poly(A) polymerase
MAAKLNHSNHSSPASHFAIEVVKRLQAAGYEALWAGGCVRDQLLGVVPKDYDVATNATPDQVREVFGRRRTLFIGASFGVVTVVGPREAGHIEVATFRRDEGYSDGRHPDHVAFSNAQEDARRRDFTVNGLFFDPIHAEVIDYVGGQQDLVARIIRCIGDPHERLDEDKLRMLRAVRFATTLGFEVEFETLAAIAEHADELERVSAERIAAEMRRVLVHERASLGLELLRQTGLWRVVLPEYAQGHPETQHAPWPLLIHAFRALSTPRDFTLALATLAWPLTDNTPAPMIVADLRQRWKLTRQETKDATWLLEHLPLIQSANTQPWPIVQPVLVDPRIAMLLELAEVVIQTTQGAQADPEPLKYCRSRLDWPAERLNPPPLVDGKQLQSLGIAAGPELGKLLRAIRAAQLQGQLQTTDQALRWAAGNHD